MVLCDLKYTFLFKVPDEKNKERKYDEATQILVDAADAARKEFETVDRKHR